MVFALFLIFVVGLVAAIYYYHLQAGLNQTPSSTGTGTSPNTLTTTLTGNEVSGPTSTSSWTTSSSTTINSPVNEVETIDEQLPKIMDPNYVGWRGTESLVKPFSKYMAALTGADGFTGDFFWPFVSSENPLEELSSMDDIAIVVATIDNITRVQVKGVYAYVIYEVKINRVVKNASIPYTLLHNIEECSKSKLNESCEILSSELEAMRSYLALIKEDGILEVRLTAFISKDAIGKKNLTIKDVATPFPLLNPGNKYLLFLQITATGVRVYYDFVWGPYAYLIKDDKVYSLNYIEYPVELEPIEFFEDDNISWEWGSYTYSELRQLAIQKLKAYAIPSDDFIKSLLD